MKLSIVVPVFNEAENIFPLIEEIVQAMQSQAADYEIIYVDDGSDDETADRLKQAKEQYSVLRVIRHATSCGQSAAVRTGIRQAKHEVIATLDGDGQNDPADIPRLYKVLTSVTSEQAIWMVAGWRQKRLDSGWRIFSSKLANAVRGFLLKDNTPDTGCGLKVFYRARFLDLPYFDHMHRFLPALIIREGGQVVSEPVNHRSRERGVSKYGTWGRLWVGIIDIVGVMWLIKRSSRVVAEEV